MMTSQPPVFSQETYPDGFRGMSTLGKRASSQRPHDRTQRLRILVCHVILIQIDQGPADYDRATVCGAEQVADVDVLTAACFGGGGVGCDAVDVDRVRPCWRSSGRIIKVRR